MTAGGVVIVGAGLGGLTAALALLQRGRMVTVLEQAAAPSEVGNGIQLAPNGTRALSSLGLDAGLSRRHPIRPTCRRIRAWQSGEAHNVADLAAAERRYGAPYLFMHRADLHAELTEAVARHDPEALRWGARVVGLQQSANAIEVRLASGDLVLAEAVVGADGVRSVVRRMLFGGEARATTGHTAWRDTIDGSSVSPAFAEPVMTSWVGPGGHVVHYPLRGGELINVVAVMDDACTVEESWSARATTEDLLASFADWHPDLLTLLRAMRRPQHGGLFVRPNLCTWTASRVTLLGDAAHPILPFMAQGACLAIEDAIVVARCLAHESDPATAFARYEAARRVRRQEVALASARNGARSHDPRLREAAADDYLRKEWRQDREADRYDWIYRYDAGSVPLPAASGSCTGEIS